MFRGFKNMLTTSNNNTKQSKIRERLLKKISKFDDSVLQDRERLKEKFAKYDFKLNSTKPEYIQKYAVMMKEIQEYIDNGVIPSDSNEQIDKKFLKKISITKKIK